MIIKTYKTKRSMPEDEREKAKACIKCHRWFTPERFERVCLSCLTPSQRALRASRYNHTNPPKVVTNGAGQRRARDTVSDVRAAKRWAFRITERNVRLGLQGACDLERYR